MQIVQLGKMRGDATLPPSKKKAKSKAQPIITHKKLLSGGNLSTVNSEFPAVISAQGYSSTRSQGTNNNKSVRHIFRDDDSKLRTRTETVPAFITEAVDTSTL